ncbi:MAG: hypothetical protein OXC91_04475 [Rhodobacteraceae bacterium]|nr:hypothetical protein [Paracoccaceae bacterium]
MSLFHSDGLGEIAGHVDIGAFEGGGVIGKSMINGDFVFSGPWAGLPMLSLQTATEGNYHGTYDSALPPR